MNTGNNVIDVFISHHADSAGPLVRRIAEALEESGFTCWYAPRDCEPSFAGSIVRAIRRCKVFLLVLNERSNISEHVINEINCAFERFKNHEEIILLPFRIDKCTLSDEVYYFFSRIHIMDGACPPEVKRIRELVDRVAVLLNQMPECHGQSRAFSSDGKESISTYRLTGSIEYPDNHFVGRKQELYQMAQMLNGPENKLFLVGMGGIGKSEIAKMFVEQHRDKYTVVCWISFDGSLCQTIGNDYTFPIQGISRLDYPEDSNEEYFRRKLNILKDIAKENVLIIMDNFDVTEDPHLKEFCSGEYAVIFTTRYHQNAGHIQEIEIKEMVDRDDLLALFQTEYTRALDETGLAMVDRIIHELNGHTLSIRLVASAMNSRRIKPEQMYEMLRSGTAAMVQTNAKAAEMIYGRLGQVFSMAMLSEEELFLMKNMALLPLSGLDVETFFDWCGLDEYEVVDSLIQKSWVIHNPVSDEVHLHPLIADLMVEELVKDPDSCNRYLERLTKECVGTTSKSYELKVKLMDLSQTAAARLPKDHPMVYQTLEAHARLLMAQAMYTDTAVAYKKLILMRNDLEQLSYLYGRVAHAYALSGDAVNALEYATAGYALFDGISTEEISFDTGYNKGQLFNRLLEANRMLGNYEEAIHYGELGLVDCERFYLTTPEENRAWKEYHLARTYNMMGLFEKGESFIRHAISLFESVDDIWGVSHGYDLLAQILIGMDKSRAPEALELSKQSWDFRFPMLGGEHTDMANNLFWRGNIYRHMDDETNAMACFEQALAIYTKKNFVKKIANVKAVMNGEIKGPITF